SNTQLPGVTLAEYAAAKGLPVNLLLELGLSDALYLNRPAVRIPYYDEQGQDVAVQYRIALDGSDRFRWRKGSKVLPYGLWRLREARAGNNITLVEGVSDSHTLWHHDLPALGIPGASTWR